VDGDVFEASRALAETYRTLGSGLYYEKPPVAPLPQGLYAALAAFLDEAKEAEEQRAGFAVLKDSEVFLLLAFLARLARFNANGRRFSRSFLSSLRSKYPADADVAKEEPRIVLP
jgi:hypothetical protein